MFFRFPARGENGGLDGPLAVDPAATIQAGKAVRAILDGGLPRVRACETDCIGDTLDYGALRQALPSLSVTSISVRITASGVRNSCDAFATNRFCDSKAAASRSRAPSSSSQGERNPGVCEP